MASGPTRPARSTTPALRATPPHLRRGIFVPNTPLLIPVATPGRISVARVSSPAIHLDSAEFITSKTRAGTPALQLRCCLRRGWGHLRYNHRIVRNAGGDTRAIVTRRQGVLAGGVVKLGYPLEGGAGRMVG